MKKNIFLILNPMKSLFVLSLLVISLTVTAQGQYDTLSSEPNSQLMNNVIIPNTTSAHADSTEQRTGSINGGMPVTSNGSSVSSNSVGKSEYFNAIFFSNTLTGYAVGEAGIISKTIDGGNSWVKSNVGSGSELHFTSVYFTDSLTGYIAGYVSNTLGTLLKTNNGGNSWEIINTGSNLIYNKVYFLSNEIGFAIGSGVISKTVNGGASWTHQFVGEASLTSITFTDNRTGFITATEYYGRGKRNSIILKTIDGGQNWTGIKSNSQYGLSSISFLNDQIGFAGGEYGSFVKTSDGGNTWSVVALGTDKEISSIDFTDESIGYVVGYGGLAMKTTDGGQSWQKVNFGGANLSGVQLVNQSAFAVGSGGSIIKK